MEGFCRGCLKYNDPTELLQYCERNRRMFVYSTGLQVKRNDIFIFQLCKECHMNMKVSCKFKKQCRLSDRKFKNYLSLKENEDSIDFSTYIKNTEDNITLKVPMVSASSTPAHQSSKDDDNESTCTSIRNFMTDILQGEEMPPSEALIISEVIQEEADILDDSLDSHWLNDDLDSEFGMDFNFSSFSTPLNSINGDHCYTPRKLNNDKERELKYYTPKEIIQQTNNTKIAAYNDMPILDDIDLENSDNHVAVNNFLSKHCKELIKELNKQFARKHGVDYAAKKSPSIRDNSLAVEHDYKVNMHEVKNEILPSEEICYSISCAEDLHNFCSKKDLNTNQYESEDIKNFGEATLNSELDDYINKVESKQKIDRENKFKEDDKHDTIDRNLEKALRNETTKEFSLDKIILSPQDSIRTGISTPTIRNILFGSMTPKIVDPKTTHPAEIEGINSNNIIDGFLNNKQESYSKGKDIRVMKKILKDDSEIDEDIDMKNEINIKQELSNDDSNIDSLSAMNEDNSQDLDISISKLLDTGDNEVDLNMSIASDFLKGSVDTPQNEIDPFKRPFSPPDDKFYLENKMCKICNKEFISARAFKIHFAKIHKAMATDFLKMCQVCGKTFNDASNLHKHVMKHKEYAGIKKYKCEICQLKLSTEVGLKLHMKIHDSEYQKASGNLHECHICHVKLPRNCYNQHIKTHVGEQKDSEDQHECDRCDMNFASLKALRSHMRVHDDYTGPKQIEKVYICNTCGKKTRGLGNHKVHMRRHEKNFLISCTICVRGFYRMFDYNLHMRTHEKEILYNCKHCPKTFSRRRPLREHTLAAHKVTNYEYQCDHCNTKFKLKSLLKRHIKYCLSSYIT